MGTRRWTFSTFVGCCLWILYGLGAAADVPVTTEGLFAAGTASSITTESEVPHALVMGTVETTVAADAEISESILAGSASSPSFSPGPELDALVTAAREYVSTAPTLTNFTKPLNTSQDTESVSAASAAAMTAASISAQHPVVTPEAELDIIGATPNVPLGTTPLFADVKEDMLEALTREGAEDLDLTKDTMSLPTTPPPATAWGAQLSAGSPEGAGVTTLLSQGLTTAAGAVEEGVTLPVGTQNEASAISSSTSPGAGGLITMQQDGSVSEAVGITPEPVEETAPAAEEGPLYVVPGNTGHAVNGEFSTASSSRLPPESPTASRTVGNPGQPSLLPGQAVPGPDASLAPAIDGDRDGQGVPGMSSEASGSSLSPAASEAPKAPEATEDTATFLLGSGVPTDAQNESKLPILATTPPRGDVGAVSLAKPSLQPDPWQTPTGEQPMLPSPIDTSSAPSAAYPAPGAGAATLPAAADDADTPANSDLSATQGALMPPSPEGSQPWETAAGAFQGVSGTDSDFSSASDALNPTSSVADGLAWPAAGVQGQGVEGAGVMAQAGGTGDDSSYADTQSDTSSSAFGTQQGAATTGELLTGGTGALADAELSPPSTLRDGAGTGTGAGAGEVLAPGQVFLPGSTPLGSAGLEPNLSGAEGLGNLPSESTSTSEAAYPAPGAAAGPVSGAETPASPDVGASQGALVSSSPEGSQSLGMAAGASQGTDLTGANGQGPGLNSAWDGPSSGAYGPAEPLSPAVEDQLGTNPGLPTAEEQGSSTAEQALGAAGIESGFEPSLSSTAGSGMAAGSSSVPSSPIGVVSASSILDPASPSALGGAGGASGALQPSLGAGPGVSPAAGEGTDEVADNGGYLGQSQAPAGQGSAVSGAPAGEMGAVLQSASYSPSMEESSSPGTTDETGNGASLPGAGGAGSGLSTGLETAGPEESPVSAPSFQSDANLGLSDAILSQANVVELPGGASVNREPSPDVSVGEGTGTITQITSGALGPSALASPQEMQPLSPVAPDSSGVSDGTASLLADSLLLPGHGLSSELAPSEDYPSAPSTQSGSRSLVPGSASGLAGNAGAAQMWSLEDEVASGMPGPLGETSPHAPVPPNVAPALPSTPQRENAAEGVFTSPGLSAPPSACESIVGSSAGGRGELGAAAPGGPSLILPPSQPGSPGAPSGDADSPVPGDVSAVLPGATAGRGDMTRLLPSATGAGAGVENPGHTLLGGSRGLPDLPSAGIAAGSPKSKTPGPGPAGGSPATALKPLLDSELTTSPANGAPATGGSNFPAAFPGQGGVQAGSPTTAHPVVSCSPATASPALPASLSGGREVFPMPGATTVTSRASSPMFPAPPRGPAAAPTPLPGPTVAAVPLYGYGAKENDREYVERRVDFNSPLFKPETGFPFGKTLRDSLYFTDNGQIIFPASDNSIFTYPNPPPSGFNGHEDVPMIAVFWDNADFSRGVGTTFYQEFLTLNTAKPPFVRDVEAKIRRYLRSSYSAAWTLKITWEKAPAYASRTDTRRTITYQAILTTDGFRSYILMLYQQGGMQWDYTRLAATNVLIGYTSADGSYRNDDLTQRPPAAKYRPDQFRGYNTDLRGLWIYKLESRVRINYRLKCLAWTGRQQEPQAWSQGLPACPCSLEQGQQDSSFKSSRRGWWAARISMLHSASPNQHGAGIRCLYDSQGQLIEGRQERYWRSSRQASPYRDQELKLYDWCCNQAGSARLCAHYSEKRPKIGCDGYQSASTAGSSEEAESDSEEQRDDDK